MQNIYLHAQLNGTYSIAPSGANTYVTLKDAIAALNAQGVSGPVTINIPAGYTEYAPSGGFSLGSLKLSTGANSLNVSRSLIIRKNGTGANPVLFSSLGTSITTDGIFKIAGASNITIDGISLRDTNTISSTTEMEWGYALLKLNSGNIYGCNMIVIKNADIKLNINNANSVGIYMGKHIATDTVSLSYTLPEAASSSNDFIANTISSVHRGIYLNGLATSSKNMDIAYRIDNNTINDFGSVAINVSAAAGIYITGSSADSIRHNVINNAQGIGGIPNNKGIIYGIYHGPAIDGSLRISGNTITIVQDSMVNTAAFYCIRTEIGGTASSGWISAPYANTLEIRSNVLMAYGGRGAGVFRLISHSGPLKNERISENVFRDIKYNGSGSSYFIDNSNAAMAGGVILICNNTLTENFRWVPLVSGMGLPPTLYGINNTGASVGTAAQPVKDSIYNNNFSNMAYGETFTAAQPFTCIKDDNGGVSSYPVKYIANNIVSNTISFRITGISVTKLGVDGNEPSYIANNQIINVQTLSAGILIANASGQKAHVHNNIIDSSYNPSLGGITGISIGSGTFEVYNNKISRLTTAATLPAMIGINILGNDTVVAYNNFISAFNVTTATPVPERSVIGINAGSTGVLSLYHNTIHLAPDNNNDTLFYSVTGLYYTNVLDRLDMSNNIIYVNSMPINGITAAIRRSTGTQGIAPSNFTNTSDANIYHASRIFAKNYVYVEGLDTLNLTNAYVDTVTFNKHCSGYHMFMMPREQSSYVEDNLTMVQSSNTYTPIGVSFAKQRAISTSPLTMVDYNGVQRPVAPNMPDIGALQFSGIVPPPVFLITALSPTTFCDGDSVLLTTSADTSVAYQWYNSGVAIAGATDTAYISKHTGNYMLVTVLKNGTCTDTSNVIDVVVNPIPVPVIAASGANNSVLTTTTFSTYQWNYNNQPISGATSQSYTATQSGTYTVTVTDANGCTGTSAMQQVSLPNSIHTFFGNDAVFIFPNPAEANVYIKAPVKVWATITGLDGRMVLQQHNVQNIDVSNLIPGIYVIRLYDDSGNTVKIEKLIIAKR